MHRWTAEEARHAFCIRDYLLVTRGIDPNELEQVRMKVMQNGFHSAEKPILHVLAYVSFQELATRLSHRNTGRFAGDPIAEKLLTRVSTDENLHRRRFPVARRPRGLPVARGPGCCFRR